jgi:hypothetical protein
MFDALRKAIDYNAERQGRPCHGSKKEEVSEN